jgi:hypothetical protein
VVVGRAVGHCNFPVVDPEAVLLLPAAELATAVLVVLGPVATAGALKSPAAATAIAAAATVVPRTAAAAPTATEAVVVEVPTPASATDASRVPER